MIIDNSNFLSFYIANQSSLVGYVIASNAIRKSLFLSQNVKYYACDSVDDDVQINLAQSECSIVVLSDGTFNISNTIVGTKSMFALQKDAVINMASALKNGIQIGGTKTQIGGDNSIQNVTAGQKSVTTLADRTASISPNDWICLADNNLWHNQRSNYYNGEFAQVESINSTTITTKDDIWLNYSGSVKRLYKYNFVSNIIVGNFSLNCGATSVGSVLLRLQCCINSSVINVTVNGNSANKTARVGLEFNECVSCSAHNINPLNIQHLGQASPQGCGVYGSSSMYLNVFNVFATQGEPCKHLIDCDKGTDYNNSNYCPISKHITFKYITAYSQQGNPVNASPFSGHGGAYDVLYENLTQTVVSGDADNGNFYGFLSRAVKVTIRNLVINGVFTNAYIASPIRIGENSNVGGVNAGEGRSAEDLTIENITLNISRTTGTPFKSTSDGNYIAIKNNGKNVIIRNVTATGLQGHFVFIDGNDNQNVSISDNNITFNNQLSGKKIVQISPKTGTLPLVNGTFVSNTITNANDTSSPYIKSVNGLTNYVEGLENVVS